MKSLTKILGVAFAVTMIVLTFHFVLAEMDRQYYESPQPPGYFNIVEVNEDQPVGIMETDEPTPSPLHSYRPPTAEPDPRNTENGSGSGGNWPVPQPKPPTRCEINPRHCVSPTPR